MSRFAEESAVERVADGRWTAHVSDRWNIGANPNGGYLVAIAMRAVCEHSPHPDPISVTTHFLRPGTVGEAADVTTELVRAGRTITTVRATVTQGGTARLEVLAALSDLSQTATLDHALSIDMPSIPPPESCATRSGLEQGIELPILDRVDVMINPEQGGTRQTGAATVTGWIRLADGTAPDVLALLLFADAFPPSLFAVLGDVGWVPTIELTVHVRRRPVPGWVLGQVWSDDLHDGRMIENGALWDSSGALVAQSRQIGLLLPRT